MRLPRFSLAGVAAFLVAGGIGAVAGKPLGDRVFAYQWADARFCDDCHAHDYANEAWRRSVHADLTTCHDCHRVPIRHYPRNLLVTVVDKPQTQDDIHRPDIPVVVCGQCHLQDDAGEPLSGPMPESTRQQVVKVDRSPMHRKHLEATSRDPAGGEAGEITCMDCHGGDANRAHSFQSSVENCRACHEDHATGLAEAMTCRQCHASDFLAPPRDESRPD